MTEKYISKAIKNALLIHGWGNYTAWDGLHVYYCKGMLHVSLDVFSSVLSNDIERYIRTKKDVQYSLHYCTRGGYLGGGNYREFNSFEIYKRH